MILGQRVGQPLELPLRKHGVGALPGISEGTADTDLQCVGQMIEHVAALALLLPTSAEGALRRPPGYAEVEERTLQAGGERARVVGIIRATAGS